MEESPHASRTDHETTNVEETGPGHGTDDHYIKRLKPVIGMEFENEHMAYEFYNTYAGHEGFSVRKFWHDKSSTNVIRTKKFVCSKAAWNHMLKAYNLEDNEWLHRLFQSKEKWALVYGRQTFCADMISTQRSESLNAMLKRYLHVRLDLLDFFKHYERAVDDRRYAELDSDFYASQTSPKVPRVRMLIQTLKEYTPAMFEIFRGEYDMVMGCCLYNSGHSDSTLEFKVSNTDHRRSHQFTVKFDPNGSKVSCSCKKFEFVGVLCRHALKVLDHNNIKELAPEYILKRWTRHAKTGPSHAIQKCVNDEETRVVLARRQKICHLIVNKQRSNQLNPTTKNEVQVQGVKRKEAGSSNKRNKSGLEQKKNKTKKGQATMYKNGDSASASSEANPRFSVPLNHNNLAVFEHSMPQLL
ncbi:hypothetical protein ACQ4PT_049636 [Festuca glaucescens]